MSLAKLLAFNAQSGNNYFRGFSYDDGKNAAGGQGKNQGADAMRSFTGLLQNMGMGNLAKSLGLGQNGAQGKGGQGSLAQQMLGGAGAAATASAGGASASAAAVAGGFGGNGGGFAGAASAAAASSSGFENQWSESWDSSGRHDFQSSGSQWGSNSGSSSSGGGVIA